MEDAVDLLSKAKNSIGVEDTDQVYAYRIRMNIARLKAEEELLEVIRAEVERISAVDNDVANISAMKGIGRAGAATIVSEIGEITQFESALKLQAYGGHSPNISGSGGKTNATGITRIRNPHLSHAVYESAVSLVKHRSPEFLEIFQREIRKGKKPTQAYIVVGKRLLYHVHSIMKNHKPYRERRPKGRGDISSGTAG